MPIEPTADTIPNVTLRLCSGTARAAAVMARDEAVQAIATPMKQPDKTKDAAPVEKPIVTTPSR